MDVSTGAAELIEEVSEGKITGEEDRYAKTDLWDFDANLQGARDAVGKLNPALVEADPGAAGQDRGRYQLGVRDAGPAASGRRLGAVLHRERPVPVRALPGT